MTELETALAAFLPQQRWFAGKGRAVAEVRVESSVPLRTALPSLTTVVATVAYADGGVERYHLPLGHDRGLEARQLTDRVPDAVIYETKGPKGGPFYDAVRDERLGGVFLDLLSRAANVKELRFYRMPEWTETLRGPGKLVGAEQSNSSLVFGNKLILKLFRLLEPGENPELEVTRALAAAGFTACPAPLGWIEGLGSTLGILQRFYAGSVDGWKLATERVADHYEADGGEPDNFAADAGALGRLTAELHNAMATALPKVAEGQPDLGRLSARLLGQLAQVAALVPELAGLREAIEEVYTKAEAAGGGSRYLQRIHGDYHLGQVLKAKPEGSEPRGGALVEQGRWVVIDLEGEPARSLAERRRLASPLQDVAGMLRSFDYAAFQPLVLGEDPDTPGPTREELARFEGPAAAWIEANRSAFLDGYLAVAGDSGPALGGDHELLLRAFELDKAVYEVMYEARHRPPWLQIPLGGIRRLLGASP
ncbi:MAG TPA: phosphotransferase [Actinomycetes bacterium]|nr:phosphotransferase [Actinomycetes bacterium]